MQVTTKEAEAVLDTVTQNPDSKEFACPPDGVRGLSTIARQKIATTLAANGTPGDYWIVEWDHEPDKANDCSGFYVCSDLPEDGTGYHAGHVRYVNEIASGWAGAGYATSLVTGGVCIYKMQPGQSPFPASDGTGPYVPLQTTQLLFGPDILHDRVRVVGANTELVDTTNSLNQQGNVFSGAWDSNAEIVQMIQMSGNFPGTTKAQINCFSARMSQLPPGSTEDLLKLNNNRMGAAKEGHFNMARIDMANNKPSSSVGQCALYESIVDHPLLPGYRIYLALYTVDDLYYDTTSNVLQINQNTSQSCRIYPTGTQLNCTVYTGLSSTNYAATLSREITVECFIQPRSEFAPYAKIKQTPADPVALAAMQNIVDSLQQFNPSKSNRTGKFAKMAKGLWKKVSPVVRPIVAAAGNVLLDKYTPEGSRAAFQAAEKVYTEIQQGRPVKEADLLTPAMESFLEYKKEKARRKVEKGESSQSGSKSAAPSKTRKGGGSSK